jgi:hypothetical protein
MRNLVSSAFVLAAAVAATGCIIVDDDDDDGGGDDDPILEPTELNVTWRLFSNAEAALCQPGSNPTATLYACAGDCPPGTDPYVDVADCASTASSGTILVPENSAGEALLPGDYLIWVEFAANGSVYAKSFSDPVTLTRGRRVDHSFDVQVDHGFFDAAWTLVRADAAITCDAAGAVDVELLPSGCNAAGGADCTELLEPADLFECDAGSGKGTVPRPFSAFGYEVDYSALDAQGTALASVSQSARGEPFAYGNEAQNLGTLVIETD